MVKRHILALYELVLQTSHNLNATHVLHPCIAHSFDTYNYM